MKLRDIRFHEAVAVDRKMLDVADHGEACAFGVVIGADQTLVPWTNVRWAKREPAIVLESPTEFVPDDEPGGTLLFGNVPKKRRKREEAKP